MEELNMRHFITTSILRTVAVALLPMFASAALAQMQQTSAPQAQSQVQMQSQPQAQGQAGQMQQGPPMICGNNSLCQETQDFAATITSFRVSTNVYKARILDMTVRFQNKTNQQLILGYVNQSGTATDDRGNRSVPWGANAYLGIGLVAGSNFDPRFVLRPGGWGDAQFEYVQQGSPQLIGFVFTLDFAISEINSFEGNQHTLGGEFPLHYDGLRNGIAASSPMFNASSLGGASNSISGALSNPCGTAGSLTQGNAAGSNAVSNATNAINAVSSLWHRKKQNAAQNSQAAPCDTNSGNAAVANTAQPALQPAQAVSPAVQSNTSPAASTSKPSQPTVVQATTRTNVTQSNTAAPAHPAAATAKPAPRTAISSAVKPATMKNNQPPTPGTQPPQTAQPH
jgi:hypothetical protein